jgi:acyl-coenzyme A synthetase/AMP-(fatty) acid ligase
VAPVHEPASLDAEAVALIQYTSGSTGDPKGVKDPRQPLANIRALGQAFAVR